MNETEITREEFERYEQIRTEGKYNMIMDAAEVASLIGIDLSRYSKLIKNYSKLAAKYGQTKEN